MTTLGQVINQVTVPARHGKAVTVRQGQLLKVTSVQGKQICDFWAFNPTDTTEFLSTCYTRSELRHLRLQVGKALYNNKRQPILQLEEDKVGVHDMFVAACDPLLYLEFGATNHRSCKSNALEAMAEFYVHPPVFPDLVNLFQSTPADEAGALHYGDPQGKAEDYVLFRALSDLLAVGSACPFDQAHAEGRIAGDILFQVYSG